MKKVKAITIHVMNPNCNRLLRILDNQPKVDSDQAYQTNNKKEHGVDAYVYYPGMFRKINL